MSKGIDHPAHINLLNRVKSISKVPLFIKYSLNVPEGSMIVSRLSGVIVWILNPSNETRLLQD